MSCDKPRGGREREVRIVQEPWRAAQASVCETVLMVDDRALSFLWLMCLSYLY